MNFESLNNTRDLGGLPAADGRVIKPGRLLRSGGLTSAAPADIAELERLKVSKVIDFRSVEEREEKPDPEIKGAVQLHIPAVKDMAAGITRDERSQGKVIDAILLQGMAEPGFAMKYMCSMYEQFVADEFSRSQYARFIREVAYNSEGVTLWHCNAGKDRTGFAAVLIQKLLGVEEDVILSEYLKTNENIAAEVDELVERLVPADAPEGAEAAVRMLFSADEAFLNALYAKADELYGSFEGFLTEGLGVDEKLRRRLRTLFLTPAAGRIGA